MEILTPEKVKTDGQREQAEQRARVRDLSIEEERLIASVNFLREEEKREKERIGNEMTAARVVTTTQKSALLREVEQLEERKKVALKPVEEEIAERMAVVEKSEDSNKRESSRLVELAATLSSTQETTSKNATEAKELLASARQKSAEAETKLANASRIEDAATTSSTNLAGKWAAFHKAEKESEERLWNREQAADVAEHANTVRAEALDKKALEQAEKERQIASQYEQLEKASAEIYKLKNEHGA